MLDIQTIQKDPGRIRRALEARGWPDTDVVDRALACDAERRGMLTQQQKMQAEANAAARAIGSMMRTGRKEEAQELIAAQAACKRQEKKLADQARDLDGRLRQLLLDIPNIPRHDVPPGSGPEDNVITWESPELPRFEFAPLPHWTLAERHGLIDFERGAKVTGAGFPFYMGKGARLQRALIQFFLDRAVDAGYNEIQPPLLVNEASARGTGQLPDKESQMYVVQADSLFAVPTAEVPLTNLYREEILQEEALPVLLCAHSPCWRREAGSYGMAVRGLNRLHQFDKVELVHIVHPDRSHAALGELCAHSERLLQALGLPYRKLFMCAGELGFNQAVQYDLEVWSAAQERWLEVSSVSNFTDYQARRMRMRFKPKEGGKPKLVHTLNGSALALPRVLAALLENNQTGDGSVAVPPCLQAYTGFEFIG